VSATRTPNEGAAPTRAELEERLRDAGLEPRWWSNPPGDRYDWHEHGYHKVLYCASGGIVFHTDDGDFELAPGDRLDVTPGTRHAATVGPEGVECVEAPA
jgi:quercetin dioxygenase-like cupin family protein